MRATSIALLCTTLAACASPMRSTCATGEQLVVNDLVYFGTARANGDVTPAEWDAFLRADVTPRFPQGLSVWQASGQWRTAAGAIVRESSYVLNVVHPDDEASDAAIGELRERYRVRFEQESTMRVRHAACVSF